MYGYGPHAARRYFNDVAAGWFLVFKNPDSAQQRYENSLALHPGDGHAKNCLAGILSEKKEYARALKLYEELAVLNDKQAAYPFNQAFIHDLQGNLPQAEALFLRTLEIDPFFDRAHYGLGLIYVKTNRLVEAAAMFEKNTKIQPMSPYGWYQLALVYMNLGRVSEAHTIERQLSKFEPKFARGLKLDLEKLAPQSA